MVVDDWKQPRNHINTPACSSFFGSELNTINSRVAILPIHILMFLTWTLYLHDQQPAKMVLRWFEVLTDDANIAVWVCERVVQFSISACRCCCCWWWGMPTCCGMELVIRDSRRDHVYAIWRRRRAKCKWVGEVLASCSPYRRRLFGRNERGNRERGGGHTATSRIFRLRS